MLHKKISGIFNKDVIDEMKARCITLNKHSKKIIVFPETDEKILRAAAILIKKGICHPIILGNPGKLRVLFEKYKIKDFDDENMFDYLSESSKTEFDEYVQGYFTLRQTSGKSITMDEAKQKISMPHFYAAMMVEKGLADGMISGINSETKPYFPAFEIIKTREGISRASGLFMMVNGKKTYLFADCALNMNPTAEQLSEIAYTTAQTAISFGIKPKIAMLSFSTHGTAKHELVDKVVKATALLKEKDKDLIVDGEIQLDAAIIPEVAAKKCKDSPLAGEANILIFPDLNSGNIGYKLAERLGGYKAIGPIMQGLNKPINDLSRGCSVDDIVDLAVITVIQGL